VYDFCHVGHARTAVAFDVIVRHLRAAAGLTCATCATSPTSTTKSFAKGWPKDGLPPRFARIYAEAMAADMDGLGVAVPDIEPRATLHIAEMIDVIRGWKNASGLRRGR